MLEKQHSRAGRTIHTHPSRRSGWDGGRGSSSWLGGRCHSPMDLRQFGKISCTAISLRSECVVVRWHVVVSLATNRHALIGSGHLAVLRRTGTGRRRLFFVVLGQRLVIGWCTSRFNTLDKLGRCRGCGCARSTTRQHDSQHERSRNNFCGIQSEFHDLIS